MDCSLLAVCKSPPIASSRLASSSLCDHSNFSSALFAGILRPQLGHKRGGSHGHSGLVIRAASTLPQTPESSRRSGFIEPVQLLQSNDAERKSTDSTSPDEEPSSSGQQWSTSASSSNEDAFYKIQVYTSNEVKSDLTEVTAGVAVAMIGESGEALVQRIPPVKENADASAILGFRFQKGSIDELTFRGPNLGRLAALWIAPEAGTWRVEKAIVTIVPLPLQESSNVVSDGTNSNSSKKPKSGLYHVFEGHESILGDGGALPAAELSPAYILELGSDDPLAAIIPAKRPRSSKESTKQREDGLKEYMALKVSLLSSTALMVTVGTLGLFVVGAPDLAQSFAVGGAGGLLYLFLLQKTVDQLPSLDSNGSETNSTSSDQGGMSGQFSPATGVVLVAGIALVTLRLVQGGASSALSPGELLAGGLGFLTSRVAVFLTAFKPDDGNK